MMVWPTSILVKIGFCESRGQAIEKKMAMMVVIDAAIVSRLDLNLRAMSEMRIGIMNHAVI